MATKGKRPMRALTPNDKIVAIQRVNDGESKASVARDIGVPESTLRGWCKNEDKLRYMNSRISSPDTEKSNDSEPQDKRARTESPAAPPSPVTAGLDLSASVATPVLTRQPPPPTDAPVELTTTKRAEPSPPSHTPRERRPDPGASVSMSAISPLSGLAHLPALAHSHLGLSFNEIATKLSLFAHLNPALSALSAQPASRALRSVRSTKPAHNGILNLNDSKHHHRSKTHDSYRLSKSSHHGASHSSVGNQPMDEALRYWLYTQQAMLDLTAKASSVHSHQLGKSADPTIPPKLVSATAPFSHGLDFTNTPWMSQYYKQVGGAMPLPDDKLRSASQVPKDKSTENILYSHLTKATIDEGTSSSVPTTSHNEAEARHPRNEEPREPTASPEIGAENKEPSSDRNQESSRSQTRARTVLDNLLFSNSNQAASAEVPAASPPNVEWEADAAVALEHGEKFLAWLEASGDPSVTRMHVHQLRALLHNLRTRRQQQPPLDSAAHLARRK